MDIKFTSDNIFLLGSILLFLSILSTKASFKLGIPVLVTFIVVGMLAGSDGIGGIYYNNPKISQIIGIIALNFILFSGGLETKWENVKPAIWKGISLSTLGVVLTMLITAICLTFITPLSYLECFLLGAIVSSTDATAVFSILRTKKLGLKGNLQSLLEFESGSNDPMAYFLTISIISLITNSSESFWYMIPSFFIKMSIGAIVGLVMGKIMVYIINKINVEQEGLYPVLLLSLIFFTFSISDHIGGNGFLSVYLSAMILGNNNFLHKRKIIKHYDGQAWLMQIVMFLTLGLLVFPKQLVSHISTGMILSVFIIFIARPIAVFISLSFFKMKFREKLFISWVGLRGAVPIIFATYPIIAGISNSNYIFNLVFFVALSSVLIQGTTLAIVAKYLRVALPKNVKKNDIALALSEKPQNQLYKVRISKENSFIGKSVVSIHFPNDARIVLINRDETFFAPEGYTILKEKDVLMISCSNIESEKNLNILFGDKPEIITQF